MVRRAVFVTAAALMLGSALALYLDGRVPSRGAASTPYEPRALLDALVAVDAHGQVNLAELKARHAALERYVESLASAAPSKFDTADERVAFWLNAAHGLVLVELLDARSGDATSLSRLWRTWPVAGEFVNRSAIERRFFAEAGDPRIWLALFTGAKGRGVLDGAPFDGASLDPQLDDAAKRFMTRRENLRVDGHVAHVSSLLREHEAEFLAALPDDRKQLLQIVWAFLPDECSEPGCTTRGDLDRACGQHFDQCTVVWEAVDESLAVTH